VQAQPQALEHYVADRIIGTPPTSAGRY